MALQTLNIIKSWFKTGLKPTQTQFWDTWDSFRHKYEKVPVKEIEGIDELLSSKADKTVLNDHLADKNAHAPQVNTDWNSESGFSKLLNKPEFKTINGEIIVGTGDIVFEKCGLQNLHTTLNNGNEATDKSIKLISAFDGSYVEHSGFQSKYEVTGGLYSRLGKDGLVVRPTEVDPKGIEVTATGVNFTVDDAGWRSNLSTEPLTASRNLLLPDKTGKIALISDIITPTLQEVLTAGNEAIAPDLYIVLDNDYGYTRIDGGGMEWGNTQLGTNRAISSLYFGSGGSADALYSEGLVSLAYTEEGVNGASKIKPAGQKGFDTYYSLPKVPSSGRTVELLYDGSLKTINGESIVGEGDIVINGEIQEAPINGNQYGRQNGEWTEITSRNEPYNLQQILDTGNTATIGSSKTNLMQSIKGDLETTFQNINGNNSADLVINSFGLASMHAVSSKTTTGLELNANDASTNKIQLYLRDSELAGSTTVIMDSITNEGHSVIKIPQKVGEHTIATLADIPQTLQQTLNNGNILNSSSWIAFPRLSIFNGNITLNSAPYTNQMDLTGNITENTEDGSKFETNSDRIKLVNSIEPGGLIFSPTYGGAGTTYTNATNPVSGDGVKQVIPVSVNSVFPDNITGNINLPITLQNIVDNNATASSSYGSYAAILNVDKGGNRHVSFNVSNDSSKSSLFELRGDGSFQTFGSTANGFGELVINPDNTGEGESHKMALRFIQYLSGGSGENVLAFEPITSSGKSLIKIPYKSGNHVLATTSDLAIDNLTVSSLSRTELNSTYPNAVNGFRVHCPFVTTGGLIYEKTTSGWLQISASMV
ncbi:hypothetical protein [Flavobacterium sp. N502536]|uniref:hypothetical protein n=1 Tax=Flavobacterium sp. N502536 TaxID=2986837 RepID=UPI002222B76C|nr:hypothetical protein [Flavobacterium sp. N502536]